MDFKPLNVNYGSTFDSTANQTGKFLSKMYAGSNGVDIKSSFDANGNFIFNQPAADIVPQVNTGEVSGGMTGTDWAGLGIGALNTGLGFLSNKANLDVAQGNLNLSKDKFAYLKQQDTDTRNATEANRTASLSRVTG